VIPAPAPATLEAGRPTRRLSTLPALFALPDRPRILVLGGDRRPDLLACLRALRPDLAWEARSASAEAWFPELPDARLGGILAVGDEMGPLDLRVLALQLRHRSDLEALLLPGARGLAGAEEILEVPGLRLLPEPWTLAGLRRSLGEAAGAAAPGAETASEESAAGGVSRSVPGEPPASPGAAASPPSAGPPAPAPPAETDPESDSASQPFGAEFLGGAVEGLRDPLTSISGYLQLLRSQAEAREEETGGTDRDARLLDLALLAARELDRLLEALDLATSPRPPHPRELDLAEELRRAVEGEGRALEQEPEGEALPRVRADARLLQAGLHAARLLLARFGPAGRPRLRIQPEGRDLVLAWVLEPASPDAVLERTRPPAFLPRVLEALAARMGAEAVLERRGVVPVRAGLRLPAVLLRENLAPTAGARSGAER